jgi:L-lactate dehydrogenase complex protein LldG
MAQSNPILENIRRSLDRQPGAPPPPRPPVLPPRPAADTAAEIDSLIKEINALSGVARRLNEAGLDAALQELVREQEVRKATLWPTPTLARLNLVERLRGLDVEIVPHNADKQVMALCDLGITEVDFALPETGTLALLSSPEKPRAVSLLPRVHLAVMHPSALRADLHQVFADARLANYMIFITGPSRTADIELTTTLGVHGPKALYLWVMD